MTTLAETLLKDIAHTALLDWKVSVSGDIETVEGVANLSAALLRRLLTVPGSIVTLPTYGVGIKLFQNAPLTLAKQRDLAVLIQEQFARDPRVEKVTGVKMRTDNAVPGYLGVDVRVLITGGEETGMSFDAIGDDQ